MLKALRLSELLAVLDARLVGADAQFSAVSTDSRKIEPGQLFIALSGPNFDGHDYLAAVAAKGAVAALVEREVSGVELPQLLVADARMALGQLGALNRQAYQGPLAAVTGSSGKTTVKEMLASILRAGLGGPVLATRGNLNNDLGAPLTLLELAPRARRRGDRAGRQPCRRDRLHRGPDPAPGGHHQQRRDRPRGRVRRPGQDHRGQGRDPRRLAGQRYGDPQPRRHGLRHLAARAPAASGRAELCPARQRGGLPHRASWPAMPVAAWPLPCSRRPAVRVSSSTCWASTMSPMPWPPAAAAHALNVPLVGIQAGLESLQPVKGRAVARLASSGARVIDDTYNANPISMCAAVDILAGFSGRTVLVLGDMGELGEWAEQGHRDVGAYAAGKVDALYAVGPLMAHAVAAFGPQGQHFADQASLIAAVLHESAGSSILIKGSRSAAMENVVAALCGKDHGEIH